ncbi:MAG: hypothetical protein ACJ8CR_04330 [Roseiflexaceae bacterium]
MLRRKGGGLSVRQVLAVVAILLALLSLAGIGNAPWLVIAVIVLALALLL